MNQAEKIGELLFRHSRQKISNKEKMELNDWRHKSLRNEEIYQSSINPEHLRLRMKKIDQGRSRVFKILQHRFPELLPRKAPVRQYSTHQLFKLAAISLLILGITVIYRSYKKSVFNEKDFLKPGTYTANIVSSDDITTALDNMHRGIMDGWNGIKREDNGNENLAYVVPNDSNSSKEKMVKIYTPRGGVFCLRFPDGTLVWLNAETSITFPANFKNDSIKMMVKGEAYFETTLQSKLYFIETADRRFVTSAGSHFDLQSYPREEVKITDIADSNDIIAWKNGFTTFHNAPIQTIMQSIARWYNAKVTYEIKYPNKRFNISVPRNASIYDVLKLLEMQGAHLRIEGETIVVH